MIGPQKCIGPHCFRLTFVIMACICVLGCSALLYLTSRTRNVYLDIHKQLATKRQPTCIPEVSDTGYGAKHVKEPPSLAVLLTKPSTITDVHRLRHSISRQENVEESLSLY